MDPRRGISDFLLIPPSAVLVSLGMLVPEYCLFGVAIAFPVMFVLAVIGQSTDRP